MQVNKVQNKAKYESFDYGQYEKLKKLFHDPSFEPIQVEELDLSNEKATQMPNVLCLQLLTHLRVLVLNGNQIQRFPGKLIAKELQCLTILDLSNNLIEELDDIADLNLPNLSVLDYQGNYVCSYLLRITQIQQLLCPKRYVKYNPVKVFTASYNQLPVCRLTEAQYLEEKKCLRSIQRAPEEFKPEELMNTVSKFSHKNTLGKFCLEMCPVPRKTRFKNLEYLNGTQISKMDIMRVTGVDNYKLALEVESSQTKKQNQINKSKLHNEYIQKYIKRVQRLLEEKPSNDPDEILKAKKAKKLDPKKFSIWETPLDIQYKDSEFTIGIEEFKQQQKEFQEQKKEKMDRRHKKQIERIKKKHPSFEESESDHEIRRMCQPTKVKPKMNLSRDEDKVYRSSESSFSEGDSPQERSSTSQESVEMKGPKSVAKVEAKPISHYRRKPKEEKKNKEVNQQRKIQQQVRQQRVEMSEEKSSESQEDTSPQIKKSSTTQLLKNHSNQNSHSPVQVPHQPIPAQKIMTKMLHDENRNTFDLSNKLSAPHPIIREGEFKEQQFKRMLQVKEAVQKERQELEQIRKPITAQPQQRQKINRVIVDGQKKKALPTPQRELVKLHGDLDKAEFQRIQIPLEEMIPTEEQGVPERFRQEFLYNVDSETYKELLHYKGILEESLNLREAWKEMDGKLEILGATKPDKELKFKANDYNAVHTYLKAKYKDKISPYEMREIIYGANDYDTQAEPRIQEKDILKRLEQEDVTQEERQVLYKWIEILDDIRLKQTKTDDKRLRRIEIKEIERAQSFAHLAYHYQKLKKYVPAEKLQKYVKMMGIPLNEILNSDNQKLKTGKKKKAEVVNRSNYQSSKASILKKNKEQKDLTKQMQQIEEDKAKILKEYEEINQQRYSNIKAEILSENGNLATNDPYYLKCLNQLESDKTQVLNKVAKYNIPFENMVEQNLRKLHDQQFMTQQGATDLEEQMMKYASEFKEKIKQRERLQQNINKHISETQKKLDEFWMWEAKERELRDDKVASLMRQIKRLELDDQQTSQF